jgi:hypothetical protein
MLRVVIPAREFYDDVRHEFVHTEECELQLEHSLVSLSKWEAKWCKPFLSKTDKTREETLDYIRCMTMNQNHHCVAYNLIPDNIIQKIIDYINAPMTATTFKNPKDNPTNKEVITAEIIYYWMITFNIPIDFQKRHLNQLLTLINVCNIKNQPPKKMSAKERAAENKARRTQYNTKG